VIAYRYSTIIYWTKFPWVSHLKKKKLFSPFERRFPYLLLWNFSDGTGWKILRGAWKVRGKCVERVTQKFRLSRCLFPLCTISSLSGRSVRPHPRFTLTPQHLCQHRGTEYYTEVHLFCVSSIRHDSSLSKYRKQKQSPPGLAPFLVFPGGWLLLFTVLAEWRIMTNRAYAKSNGDWGG
jgi:hypothetical protein